MRSEDRTAAGWFSKLKTMEDRGNKSHTKKKCPIDPESLNNPILRHCPYETWSQGAHPVEALGRQTVVSIQYWCLSEPCTKPGRVNRVICTKIQLWEITPHIATSIPRQTSSGTKSATSGISETFPTECSPDLKCVLEHFQYGFVQYHKSLRKNDDIAIPT